MVETRVAGFQVRHGIHKDFSDLAGLRAAIINRLVRLRVVPPAYRRWSDTSLLPSAQLRAHSSMVVVLIRSAPRESERLTLAAPAVCVNRHSFENRTEPAKPRPEVAGE